MYFENRPFQKSLPKSMPKAPSKSSSNRATISKVSRKSNPIGSLKWSPNGRHFFLLFWRSLALTMLPGAARCPREPPKNSVRVHFGTIWSLKCGLHWLKNWARVQQFPNRVGYICGSPHIYLFDIYSKILDIRWGHICGSPLSLRGTLGGGPGIPPRSTRADISGALK